MDNLFADADQFIEFIEKSKGTLDDFITLKYTGFVSVTAVTSYEVAIKKLLIEFAYSKHSILGNFADAAFSRLDAKIRIGEIEKYLSRFGQEYSDSFSALISA